jgi:hypothetical protein
MRERKTDLAKLTHPLKWEKILTTSRMGVIMLTYLIADNGAASLPMPKLNPESGEAFIRTHLASSIYVDAFELIYQVVRFGCPNIMVGNTILLKHQ